MTFKTEAELCSSFIEALPKNWTAYPETCGYDIVLVRDDGFQVAVEAKLVLNGKVLSQILPHRYARSVINGPDCLAVLVPNGKTRDLLQVCGNLGVTVIQCGLGGVKSHRFRPSLPAIKQRWDLNEDWFEQAPEERLNLPDYVPDVAAGVPSPITLSIWKVQAIKATHILDIRGYLTRSDFRALKINPSSWCSSGGYLAKGETRGQWVRCSSTPDFSKIHPTNFAQIIADQKWQEAHLLAVGGDGGVQTQPTLGIEVSA